MAQRIALVLYLAVLILLAVDLTYVSGWHLGLSIFPILFILGAVFLTRRITKNSASAMLHCLMWLGLLGLLLVALVLTVPVWQALNGISQADAGRLAPLFVGALILYGANLWVDIVLLERDDRDVDRIARLLSGPRLFVSLIAALLLASGFILSLAWVAENPATHAVTRRFLERGIIPPLTILLFFWGVLLLFGKLWNSWHLRRCLNLWHGGASQGFAGVVSSINALAVAPATARLEENLQLLWRRYDESYLVPRYIAWAVPILGFVGTVLGISLAAEGIRKIIGTDVGLSSLSGDLSGAIAPLGIAFDTTLIALSLSLVLTLLLSLVQRTEERLLAALEWSLRGSRHGQ